MPDMRHRIRDSVGLVASTQRNTRRIDDRFPLVTTDPS